MGNAIVLFGHGSRDPRWREPLDAVARQIVGRAPDALVACAFLEFMQPDLPAAVADLIARGANAVRVVPMFLGMGKHVRDDLPRMLEHLRTTHPDIGFALDEAVGERGELIDLLAQIALRP